MSKLNKIIILVAILAIFYGIYILFIEKYFSSNPSNTVGKSIEWGNPDLAKLESDKAANETGVKGINYKDLEFSISFDHPSDFKVTNFYDADDLYTILAQNTAKNIGIQISGFDFIDPIETLTKERIENDLSITIQNYSIIKIGANSDIQAVTFLSSSQDGNVLHREVWFMHKGNLIQVKAYQSSESLIVAILKTLILI